MFQQDLIYFEIHQNQITATNVDTHISATTIDVNSFHHQRGPIINFEEAQQTILNLFKKVKRRSLLRPRCIVHYLPQLNDGLSVIEKRTLKELVLNFSSDKVFLLETPNKLTNAELTSLKPKLKL